MDRFEFITAVAKEPGNQKKSGLNSDTEKPEKAGPETKLDERQQKLLMLDVSVMLEDIKMEWSELLEEQNDLSTITHIVLDENYLWMSIKQENELAIYSLLLELIEDNNTATGKQEAIDYLEKRISSMDI